MSCGAELEANAVMDSLVEGEDFTLPKVDLTDPMFDLPKPELLGGEIKRLTNADLTSKTVDGTGTFDFLMSGFKAHLRSEYDNNRITGAEYTKAYIALTEGAMGNATQYLLGREQAYWQAVAAQQQAQVQAVALITARVTMQTAKVQLAAIQLQALDAKAKYALTKMQLATESIQYCKAKFELDNTMPVQLELLEAQKEGEEATTAIKKFTVEFKLPVELETMRSAMEDQKATTALKEFDLNTMKPVEIEVMRARMEAEKTDVLLKKYDLANTKPAEVALLVAQEDKVNEEMNVMRLTAIGQDVENRTKEYQLLLAEPAKVNLLLAQHALTNQQTQVEAFKVQLMDYDRQITKPAEASLLQTENIIKAYTANVIMPHQMRLLAEQAESARAQTGDVRIDGTPVGGVLGQQKLLYAQQIQSYRSDSQLKAARVFSDAWITMKTIDEGLQPPPLFTNPSLDGVLMSLKVTNQLG